MDNATFEDNTIIKTPTPKATSTVERKKVAQNYNQEGSEDESFGLLSINSVDLIPSLESNNCGCKSKKSPSPRNRLRLQEQKFLAEQALKKSTKRVSGLPSKFFRPSDTLASYSEFKSVHTPGRTISENDGLRKSSTFSKTNFSPANVSTPRPSADAASSVLPGRMSQACYDVLDKMRTTDISVPDFFKEISEKIDAISFQTDGSQAKVHNSQVFIPGEHAVDKLLADELSWKQQKDIPNQNNDFSIENSGSFYNSKVSMGEFFQQRSEDIRNLIPSTSPKKKPVPVPLIDSSTVNKTLDMGQKDSLTISSIERVLSEANVEDTPSKNKVLDYLYKQGNRKSQKDLTVGNKENLDTSSVSGESITLPEMPARENSQDYSRQFLFCQPDDSKPVLEYPEKMLLNIPKQCETQSRALNKTITSLRSSSSLSTLPDGKLPIESTRTELTWACLKPGKTSIQSFVLRNRSQHRLRMQLTITGSEFKVLRDHSEVEPTTNLRIKLHPLESRSVSVMFSPTKIGAAVGKLNFLPDSTDLQQSKKQLINLYGYGGHTNIEIASITRDVCGKFLLSLGDVDKRTSITKQFLIRNVGSLPGFAYLTFHSKESFMFTTVSVLPRRIVLKPQDEQLVTVTYNCTKQDIKYFMNSALANAIEIGVLKLYSGPEALRGRIRRLTLKAEQKQLQVKSLSKELTNEFPNEAVPIDLFSIKESVGCLEELCSHLISKEIVLIVERNLDQTMVPQFADETSMFQTLCADQTSTTFFGSYNNTIKIEPSSVVLTPPRKTEDSVLLTNESTEKVPFAVTVVPNDGILVSPKSGSLRPKQTVLLKIMCAKTPRKDVQIYELGVSCGQDIFKINLKVVMLKHLDLKL